MKKIIVIIAIVLASCTAALADCTLDEATAVYCSDKYASGVETCRSIHHDPLDAGDLAMCIGYTQDEYNKCTAGCR